MQVGTNHQSCPFEEVTRQFIQTNLKLIRRKHPAKTKPNDAFGTICFQGFGQATSTNSPYVKVSAISGETTAQSSVVANTWQLMRECWKVPEPKLIISVTGGAKGFEMNNPRIRDSFKQGLVKAATSADAWIMTGGTQTGVMEIVGEAVKEHRLQSGTLDKQIVLLGIATWGVIANRRNMEDKNGNGRFPCDYNFQRATGNKDASLDPNHTHFILVEDVTKKKDEFGQEIGFRSAFEQYNAKHRDDHSATVPVVLLMLEGGKNTMRTACEAIEKNTPIVVFAGSGRSADTIATAYKHRSNGKSFDELALKENWNKLGLWNSWVPLPEEKDKNEMIDFLRKLLDEKNNLLLTIIKQEDEEDSSQDIDKAIINALIKANDSKVKDQLDLAFVWNRCDVAKQLIFNMSQTKWMDFNLNEAMFNALLDDKDEFVNLFLDSGVDIRKFLTISRLRELYCTVLKRSYTGSGTALLKSLVLSVLQQSSVSICGSELNTEIDSPELLKIIGKLINKLSKDQRDNLYTDLESLSTLPDVSNGMNGHSLNVTTSVQSLTDTKGNAIQSYETKYDFSYPARELFLWAVLLNRQKLAKIFWKLGEDHISCALTASMLLSALAVVATSEEELDLAQSLSTNAQEFQSLAVGVLNECYQKSKERSHNLLIRNLDQWGKKTLFVLAESGTQMDFMEHTCCQTKLNQNWKGKMALFTPMWKILLGLLLPFIAIPLIKFEIEEEDSGLESLTDETNVDAPVDGSVRSKKRRFKEPNFFQSILPYHTAPVVKFCYHTISYIIFLGIFSFFMLTNLNPYYPGIAEYVVWVWVATMWVDEIRQIISTEPKKYHMKLAAHFSSSWNRFDIVVDLLFILSVILRLTLPPDTFIWARMFYTVTLTLYFIRFLQTFYVSRNIGPKVVMIRQMVIDLLFFLLILAVFLLAYGIAQEALLYPNSPYSWNILYNVVYEPYFSIYGQFNLDELQDDVSLCLKLN